MNRRRVVAAPVRIPIVSYLIEHPAEGTLLVDAGAHPSLKLIQSAPEGTVREQIDAHPRTILMTHLHLDHTAGLRDFPGTKLLVSRPEWDAFHAGRPQLHGYERGHLREENHEIETLDYEETDLFGDGTVTVLPTPGHTLGHVSLVVRTARGPVLLCGDAIYTTENLEDGREPLKCEDREAWRDSVAKLRAWIAEHPDAPFVPGHDPAHWATLDPAY
jgi:glyoxylase-like metal-dependent hydrolase (beta-lactamase superfamily II)